MSYYQCETLDIDVRGKRTTKIFWALNSSVYRIETVMPDLVETDMLQTMNKQTTKQTTKCYNYNNDIDKGTKSEPLTNVDLNIPLEFFQRRWFNQTILSNCYLIAENVLTVFD